MCCVLRWCCVFRFRWSLAGRPQNKKVEDNQNTAAKGMVVTNSKRECRQYMNRRGGFNKPLD